MNPVSAIDRLLACEPFELDGERKDALFAEAMREAFNHHLEACEPYRRFCLASGLAPGDRPADLAGYPYLPVSLFKTHELLSVPRATITTILRSSATSGAPSTIMIDATTARRQATVSAKLIAGCLGTHRRRVLMLDEDPALTRGASLTARSAATRGFLVFASAVEYVVRRDAGRLRLDLGRLIARLSECAASGEEICLAGFTSVVHGEVVQALTERGIRLALSPASAVAHIGGWKRLEDRKVTRRQFLDDVCRTLGVVPGRVFDFYGFTEQMGLVHGSAGLEPKRVPVYSEIVIRDSRTLERAPDGEAGLIELLTPLPHSYPGIAVLTDDIGRVVQRGTDDRGGSGTTFEVLGRAGRAEPRGCGDLLGPLAR